MSDLQDEIERTLAEMDPLCEHRGSYWHERAAAVMPLFEREARRREAAAWDKGARYFIGTEPIHAGSTERLLRRANPYAETP